MIIVKMEALNPNITAITATTPEAYHEGGREHDKDRFIFTAEYMPLPVAAIQSRQQRIEHTPNPVMLYWGHGDGDTRRIIRMQFQSIHHVIDAISQDRVDFFAVDVEDMKDEN